MKHINDVENAMKILFLCWEGYRVDGYCEASIKYVQAYLGESEILKFSSFLGLIKENPNIFKKKLYG